MTAALFLNGVYDGVLQEIITAQARRRARGYYLQPYRGATIRLLKEQKPSETHPIQLLISTTANLNNVSYVAEVIRWEDKRKIPKSRREEISRFIRKHQPEEKELYLKVKETECVNLIRVRNLRELEDAFSVTYLIKESDGTALKRRTRAGGWSHVKVPPEYLFLSESALAEELERELEEAVKESKSLSPAERKKRLSKANRHPSRTKILTHAYKRNPDVIAEVLYRANGICELCACPVSTGER